ncbi:MAG: tRNA ((37)-N6)-dimethylallyltransferase MiaA [Glaciihabitans sp.]|nr:tRNA ((37)-N6)-dimethylallyltransferase MiaA [Glaciihabitans sp.]
MLISIIGATGTGKSGLSLDVAEALARRGHAAEVVNADAMQLYRGMEIGTAKLPVAERRGIPHHLFDLLDVGDEASVADYQVHAREVIEEIQERGSIPLLVGGSGLYVSSVIYDFKFPGTDPVIRERLEAELLQVGPGVMHRQLKAVDPAAAEAIGASNGRRLVRALEVVEMTGEPFGSGLPDESAFRQPTTLIGLTAPRETLVQRLDRRVEQMWRDGLLEEVRGIGPTTMGVTASRAIGYAQAIAQINGEMDEADAIEQTAALTRRYARRQVGWFKRYPGTTWIDSDDAQRVDAALGSIGL